MNTFQLEILKEKAKQNEDKALLWLVEQAEKYQKIERAWTTEQEKETIFFLRICKEVIEGVELPKKKKMF